MVDNTKEKSPETNLSCFIQHTTWPGATVIGSIKWECLIYLIRQRCIIAGGWGQHIYQIYKQQPGLYNPSNPCALSDVDCFCLDPVGVFKRLIKRLLRKFPNIDFRITSGMARGLFTLAMLGGSVHLSDAILMSQELFEAIPTLSLDLQASSFVVKKVKVSHPLLEVARRSKMFAELYSFGPSDPASRLARLDLYQQALLTELDQLRSVKVILPERLKVSPETAQMVKYMWDKWLPALGKRAPLTGLSALDDICTKVSLEVLVDSAHFFEVCQDIVNTISTYLQRTGDESTITGAFYEPMSGVCPTYLGTFEVFNDRDVIVRLYCGYTAATCEIAKKRRGSPSKIYCASYGHLMSYLALGWVAAKKMKAIDVEAYYVYRLANLFDPQASANDVARFDLDKICGKLPARNVYLDFVRNRTKTRMYSYWSNRSKGKEEPNGAVKYHQKVGQVIKTIQFTGRSRFELAEPDFPIHV